MPAVGYEIPVPADASGHSYCKAVKQMSPPHFRSVLVKPIRQIPHQGFVHRGGWGTTGEAKSIRVVSRGTLGQLPGKEGAVGEARLAGLCSQGAGTAL